MSEPLSAAPVVVVGESSSRGADRLAVAIILALIVAFLGHVARFPFIYDDQWTIVDNPVANSLSNLLRLWGPQFAREGVPDAGRPVMLASVIVDRALWGYGPLGFHLQNLLWHGVVSVLMLLGLRHITQSLPMALFTTSLFAVHPLVAEPVAVVNYREDLLAAAFALLGVFAVAASRRAAKGWPARWRKVLAFLCFVLAAGAKESAYVAPLLVVLLDRFVPRAVHEEFPTRGLPPGRGKQEQWLDAALAAAAVGLVFAWRAWVMGHAAVVSTSAETSGANIFFRLLESVYGFVAGAAHVLYPLGLSPEYDPVALDGFGLFMGVLAFVVLAGLVAATLWLRRRFALAALGLAWALLAYVPTFGIVPITNERADRYMYLALMGLLLALVAGITHLSLRLAAKFRKGREPLTVLGMPFTWTLAAVAVMLLGLAARNQSLAWANEENLWLSAVAKAPHSARAWAGWATVLLKKRQSIEAQMAASTGLSRSGNDPRLMEILGLTHLNQGSVETACSTLKAAGDEGAPYDRAQRASNLGYCLMRLGRYEEALTHFERSRNLAPWFERGWSNAVETLKRMGRAKEAEALQREFDSR